MQVAYGDLKARIDMVRNKTGKSLIVGAYMEETGIDYTVIAEKQLTVLVKMPLLVNHCKLTRLFS